MAYRHGVYVSEVPTSILPPVTSTAGLPVVFGTAPINMAENMDEVINKPVLAYSYPEAVKKLGFAPANEDGHFDFTLCEFMRSHFGLFTVAPVVFINVLNPQEHTEQVTAESVTLVLGKAELAHPGALKSSVVVKGDGGTSTYEEGTDYELAFSDKAGVVINRLETGEIGDNDTLQVDYDYLDPSKAAASDIIGGINAETFQSEGLELISEIFPRFRLVPGMILVPKFSTDAAVAAVMRAKGRNINGHFNAISLCDIPTDEVVDYTSAAKWKNDNNVADGQQIVCWPKVKLGAEQFHLSTQVAGVICQTDATNGNVPYVSPSNKSMQGTATVLEDGTEIFLGSDNAAYLNGQGIVTGLNFIGGWKVWGNRTSVYPGVSDPKDAFIPIRRMFNWVGNSLILTFWQRLDFPLNRRQIDTVVDSANIWLNGLVAQQQLNGARVEFLETENPVTDLMDGIARFHVHLTPPSPNREIDFILEYDPSYLEGLFG